MNNITEAITFTISTSTYSKLNNTDQIRSKIEISPRLIYIYTQDVNNITKTMKFTIPTYPYSNPNNTDPLPTRHVSNKGQKRDITSCASARRGSSWRLPLQYNQIITNRT